MASILWTPHTPIPAAEDEPEWAEDEPECPAGGRHVYVFVSADVESGLYTSEGLCDECGHRAPEPQPAWRRLVCCPDTVEAYGEEDPF